MHFQALDNAKTFCFRGSCYRPLQMKALYSKLPIHEDSTCSLHVDRTGYDWKATRLAARCRLSMGSYQLLIPAHAKFGTETAYACRSILLRIQRSGARFRLGLREQKFLCGLLMSVETCERLTPNGRRRCSFNYGNNHSCIVSI